MTWLRNRLTFAWIRFQMDWGRYLALAVMLGATLGVTFMLGRCT